MNYDEALSYIHGVNHTFCKPGLDRISALCEALGNPQKDLKFIHVAGTNGKGSTSCMLANILKEAGYRTGLYTSPYIYRFNERMQINGEEIDDSVLAQLVTEIAPIVEKMEDKPTEFELITAVAFDYFKREACEVVVLEVGMGGRFDSTNIIENPLLSIITGISLDHVAFLGDTVEKIAFEKAGIIKSGSPVIYGGEDEGARGVIKARAREMGSPFFEVNHSLIESIEMNLYGTTFSYGEWKNVAISLLGTYQPKNASTVLKSVEILRERGLKIDTGAVYAGIKAAKWSARFEVLCDSPTVIFDGAHNAEGIYAAVQSVKQYYRGGHVAVMSGVLSDKDYVSIAKSISEVADTAYTITPENPRALSADKYAEVLCAQGINAVSCTDIRDALKKGMEYAKRNSAPLFCLGSLYTYSSVVDAISEIKNKN